MARVAYSCFSPGAFHVVPASEIIKNLENGIKCSVE